MRFVILALFVACGAPAAHPVASAPSEVELGIDLRALPDHASPALVDDFVLAQGDAIRRLAPAGVGVEIRHVPGWGVLYARFRARDAGAARAACTAVVAKYLASAPSLPVTWEPAVRVDAACHAVGP